MILRILILTTTLLFAVFVPTRAQVLPEEPPEFGGIESGAVTWYPLSALEVSSTDNLLYSSEEADRIAARISTARAGAFVDVPFSNSWIRAAYVGGLKTYSASGVDDQPTHDARVDSRLRFASGFVLSVRDDYARGVVDSVQVDPGAEAPFRGQRFESNAARAELASERGSRTRIALGGGTTMTRFPGDRVAGYYDTDGVQATLEGRHLQGPQTWWSWILSHEREDLSRPAGDGFDAEDRSDRRVAGRVGFRSAFSPALSVQVQAGAADYAFGGESPSNYRGLVGSARLELRSPIGAAVAFTWFRDAFASIASGAEYYVTRQYVLQADNAPAARLVAGGVVSYTDNSYPGSTPDRTDRTTTIAAWSGWRPRPWMEFRLGFRHERRSSSVPDFGYDATRWTFGIRVGG